jgi:hypothetical protein
MRSFHFSIFQIPPEAFCNLDLKYWGNDFLASVVLIPKIPLVSLVYFTGFGSLVLTLYLAELLEFVKNDNEQKASGRFWDNFSCFLTFVTAHTCCCFPGFS